MPRVATEVLNADFLVIRAKLIDVAAALDRIGRAEGSLAADPRLQQIHEALELLGEDRPERTERLQMVFSLPYQEQWQDAGK
jgi:hypothetical protein